MPDATTKVGSALPPDQNQGFGIAPNLQAMLQRIQQSPYFPTRGMEQAAAIQRSMAAPFLQASAPNVAYQLYQKYRGRPNQLGAIPKNAFQAMGMLLPIPDALAGEEAPALEPPVQRPPVAAPAKAPSILEAAGLSPEEMRRMHEQAWEEEAKGQFLDLGGEQARGEHLGTVGGIRPDMARTPYEWPLNREGLRINEGDNPFHTVLDQHMHDLALHGGYNAVANTAGGGWYALIQNGQSAAEEMKDALNEAEYAKLANSAGAIVYHDPSGTVYVDYIKDPHWLGRAWGMVSAQGAGPPPTGGLPSTEMPEGPVMANDILLGGSRPPTLSPTQLQEFVQRMLRQRGSPGFAEPAGPMENGHANGDGDGR